MSGEGQGQGSRRPVTGSGSGNVLPADARDELDPLSDRGQQEEQERRFQVSSIYDNAVILHAFRCSTVEWQFCSVSNVTSRI